MSEETFQIDPNGDVILVLRNPDAPFAVWDTSLCSGEENATKLGPAVNTLGLFRNTPKFQFHVDDPWRWSKVLQDESESTLPDFDVNWGTLRSRKAAKKNKKGKKSLLFEDRPEAPQNIDHEVPSVDFISAGPSGSSGNHASAFPEAAETIEVTQAYEEPHPEVSRESEPEAHLATESETPDEPVAKYLVSSKHLALASRYFSAKLSGPWKEAAVKQIDGCYHMDATDWDSAALLILMQVVHGKTRSVPRQMDLEMLAKLAVLVDYYDCHEVIEIYCPAWIGYLRNKLPVDYGRDMILWLLISHVFQQDDIFQKMTEVAVLKSADPVQTMELPIPSSLVGKVSAFDPLFIVAQIVAELVDWRRQDAVGFILEVLHRLLDSFRSETAGCSFECSSILLGALTKEMDKHKLLNPKPAKPYSGYSIVDTEKIVRAFRSPVWTSDFSYRQPVRHSCNLLRMIDCHLNADFDKNKTGFHLSEVVLRHINEEGKRLEKGKTKSYYQGFWDKPDVA
ncbi:hypothetical protein CMEL01_04352 [Colletotrichum melonis]|uniref:BTB domain-containing protein n=1 Tax=Colletotrichum melonis TaxID=1209925 RepID=A0AAI9UC17_9PEZI|nr:hypothetical protein CMEL01_04352 [Colletotrichum melonis]